MPKVGLGIAMIFWSLALNLVAQQSFDFALGAGINHDIFRNANLREDGNVSVKNRFSSSAHLDFNWKPPKYEYQVRAGISLTNPKLQYLEITDSGFSIQKTLTYQFIQLPLGFRFPLLSWGKPVLEASLVPHLLLSARSKSRFESGGQLSQIEEDEYKNHEDFYLAFEIGLNRVEMLSSHWGIRHGLRMQLGITDLVSKEGGRGQAYKLNTPYRASRWLSFSYRIMPLYRSATKKD